MVPLDGNSHMNNDHTVLRNRPWSMERDGESTCLTIAKADFNYGYHAHMKTKGICR